MKAVIGIYNSELKARKAVEKLVDAGVNGDHIQLLSRYAWSYENAEPSTLVDPNANIFSLDHNGLDVPFTEESDSSGNNIFRNKLNAILSNSATDDISVTLNKAEEAGYVVVVESSSSEILNKASDILKV